jgi:hypothetical protein
MKFLFALSLLLFLHSCEIEKLEPNDVIPENPPGWNPGTEPIDPSTIIIPCTLQPYLVRFNNQNTPTNASSISINPPFITLPESGYTVVVPLVSSLDLEMFFVEEPLTGYYTTRNYLDTSEHTIMHARVWSSSGYYTGNEGADVYVQNYGDSIRISYCDIDFTNSFTVPDSKGQFVFYP